MIALATLNTTLERALAVARQPDKGRDARLTAHRRTRFVALTPDDFAAVNNARVLDTYRFISAHVALPCPLHGQPLDDEQVGQAIGDRDAEASALVPRRRRHRRRRSRWLHLPRCAWGRCAQQPRDEPARWRQALIECCRPWKVRPA